MGITLDRIYNIDCRELMEEMGGGSIDVILTSPFYNTNRKAGKNRTLENTSVRAGQYDYVRYDTHVDNMSTEEYSDFTVDLFNQFDTVLKPNGVILYNMSYGSENTADMFMAISSIISNTAFTVADCIVWKKRTAMPNSSSPNKLTRIIEYVFVIVRKTEIKTFKANKKVTSTRKTGQKMYENIFNFIEAKNNDGSCPYNKATYSTELCTQLLDIYAPPNSIVFDPFMGSGTTANACILKDLRYIGAEISENQCKWAEERLEETRKKLDLAKL